MLRRFALTALTAALAAAALTAPTTASAATRMVATGTPDTPQFDPAGNIFNTRIACAAADGSAIRVVVRCWIGTSSATSSSVIGRIAFAQRRVPSGLNYTLCAEATFYYATHSNSTDIRCARSDDTGVAVVRG